MRYQVFIYDSEFNEVIAVSANNLSLEQALEMVRTYESTGKLIANLDVSIAMERGA